jgi:hypothetical protein
MRNVSIALALAVASVFAIGCVVEDDATLADDELSLASPDHELASVPAHEVRLSSFFGQSLTMTTNLGTVTCDGACSYNIAEGTSVSVSVGATYDYVHCMRFSGWLGSCSGSAPTCNFVVDGPEQARARWVSSPTRPDGRRCIPM